MFPFALSADGVATYVCTPAISEIVPDGEPVWIVPRRQQAADGPARTLSDDMADFFVRDEDLERARSGRSCRRGKVRGAHVQVICFPLWIGNLA